MGRVPLLFWPLAIIRRTTINQLVGFRSMIIQFSLIYRYIVLTFIDFSGKRSFRLNHVSSASVRIFFSLLNQVSIFFLKKVILLCFWCFIYYINEHTCFYLKYSEVNFFNHTANFMGILNCFKKYFVYFENIFNRQNIETIYFIYTIYNSLYIFTTYAIFTWVTFCRHICCQISTAIRSNSAQTE